MDDHHAPAFYTVVSLTKKTPPFHLSIFPIFLSLMSLKSLITARESSFLRGAVASSPKRYCEGMQESSILSSCAIDCHSEAAFAPKNLGSTKYRCFADAQHDSDHRHSCESRNQAFCPPAPPIVILRRLLRRRISENRNALFHPLSITALHRPCARLRSNASGTKLLLRAPVAPPHTER